MENKKSFGAYICQRRKELGMTQKEFAQRLFVTDSAVSKWERGLAYPDITLLQSICQILEISEKELLSSSEDVEGRRSEQLARKYLRLARNYRLIQYILYGLSLVVCFFCNVCIDHRLDWFFIVFAAEAMGASLTLVPALTPEGTRRLWSLGAFTGSLLLLLLVCCIYTGGDWFLVAALGTLFGMWLVLGPWVIRHLPLPGQLSDQKFNLYMGAATVLLLLLLGVSCLYDGGSWFFVAAAGCLFGIWLVFGPWVIRHLPLPGEAANQKFNLYTGISTVLLLLLLGMSCLHDGGTWFPTAAIWTVFGIFAVLGPIVVRKLPLGAPMNRHRCLLYFAAVSGYLLAALAYQGWGDWFPMPSLPITLLCLVVPWMWMGALRYLPGNGWCRVGAGFLGTGLWVYLAPWALDRSFAAAGWYSDNAFILTPPVDLFNWQDAQVISANVQVLICLGLGVLGLVCCILGIVLGRRKR